MIHSVIKQYVTFFDGPYYENFEKLYKGVIVVVDNDQADSKFMHFALRTKKKKDVIYKTRKEELTKIIFDDDDLGILCDFAKDDNNNSKKFIEFDKDTYYELKEFLPDFMKECGCVFEVKPRETGIELIF